MEPALTVAGSCPPSVEDVLQDGGCGEHRSLTQSETDPPVDVYLPGNGRAAGHVGVPQPGGCCACSSGHRAARGGAVGSVPNPWHLPSWAGVLQAHSQGTGSALRGPAPSSAQSSGG